MCKDQIKVLGKSSPLGNWSWCCYWACSLVVRCLPSTQEVLGSIPNSVKLKNLKTTNSPPPNNTPFFGFRIFTAL